MTYLNCDSTLNVVKLKGLEQSRTAFSFAAVARQLDLNIFKNKLDDNFLI